ncbi:hypothetical protein JKP88DRAFT_243791 [Tribonema minus]|uniref:Uncharacterized protein n=1 Tax=Tribonema minus TaxID=303371 RepID=A0A835Z5B5_9STRA|nr:hypothetical protein JKP88DRAFT_243791 [Tribonema minus]
MRFSYSLLPNETAIKFGSRYTRQLASAGFLSACLCLFLYASHRNTPPENHWHEAAESPVAKQLPISSRLKGAALALYVKNNGVYSLPYPEPMFSAQHSVFVLVAKYDADAYIAAGVIDSVLRQRYEPLTVWLYDFSGDDETAVLLELRYRWDPRVRFFTTAAARAAPAAAGACADCATDLRAALLDVRAAAAPSDVVVLLDDSQFLSTDAAVQALSDALEETKAWAVRSAPPPASSSSSSSPLSEERDWHEQQQGAGAELAGALHDSDEGYAPTSFAACRDTVWAFKAFLVDLAAEEAAPQQRAAAGSAAAAAAAARRHLRGASGALAERQREPARRAARGPAAAAAAPQSSRRLIQGRATVAASASAPEVAAGDDADAHKGTGARQEGEEALEGGDGWGEAEAEAAAAAAAAERRQAGWAYRARFVLRVLDLAGAARVAHAAATLGLHSIRVAAAQQRDPEAYGAMVLALEDERRLQTYREDIHVFLGVSAQQTGALDATLSALLRSEPRPRALRVHVCCDDASCRAQVSSRVQQLGDGGGSGGSAVDVEVELCSADAAAYSRIAHVKQVLRRQHVDYAVLLSAGDAFDAVYMQRLYAERAPRAVVTWRGLRFDGRSFADAAADGRTDADEFDYADLGGCVADAALSTLPAASMPPGGAAAAAAHSAPPEDLWLSYVVATARGWRAARAHAQPSAAAARALDDAATSAGREALLSALRQDGGWRV